MSAHDWARVKAIFNDAAERTVDQRAEFLDKACRGDIELRAHVEELLRIHDESRTSMRSPAGDDSRSTLPLLPGTGSTDRHGSGVIDLLGYDPLTGSLGPRPGDIIDKYRLLSVIGAGGFGMVYLAERREPFVQRVALKILLPGMDSREVLARFEQERQALAVMDHPNVAKVLDGGATPAALGSRPYFVMEYVKGEPLTSYCDRHRLTIRQRLELFTSVCDAVQHAHTKGIIHRDLKPSNILVSVTDTGVERSPSQPPALGGSGIVGGALVKVIDFGVAKAISRTLTEKTIFTDTGRFIGTPEYISPEQAEMGGTDIDTRADIYSLGVVLYELLAGVLPFESKSLRSAAHAEILRIIREVDPPRPSTRLSGLGEDAQEIARKRLAEPKVLVHQLERELEWIPLKAMEKDRVRRYLTAVEMADDIRNYLADRPLRARPPSAAYAARKFLRRHRGAVLATGLVAISIAAGAVTSTIGFVRASRRATEAHIARISAEQSAERERHQRQRAEQSRSLIIGAVRGVSPAFAARQSTASELVDQMAAELESGAAPMLATDAAEVELMIGQLYRGIRRSSRAVAHLNAALRRLDASAEGPTLARAMCMTELGGALCDQSEFSSALAILDPAIVMLRNSAEPDAELCLGQALISACIARTGLGQFAEAEHLGREATNLLADHADRPDLLADAKIAMATPLVGAATRSDESIALLRDAVALRVGAYGENSALVCDARLVLGQALFGAGQLKDAIEVYKAALATATKLPGPDSGRVAHCNLNLAQALKDQGEFSGAMELAQAALSILRNSPEKPTLALDAREAVADLHLKLGQPREAEALYAEARDGFRERSNPLGVARVSTGLANALIEQGRFAEAQKAASEALAIRETELPEGDWRTLNTRTVLALAMAAQGESARIEHLMIKTVNAALQNNEIPRTRTTPMIMRVIDMYERWGRDADADRWRRRATKDAP